MSEWTGPDQFGCLNLLDGNAHVWIERRPAYCDRGHFCAKVEGIPDIDGADSFPRYFMDLERAKSEMREWLAWRLRKESV